MYSVSAKIVKPPGEKPDEFEATISQVTSQQPINLQVKKIMHRPVLAILEF